MSNRRRGKPGKAIEVRVDDGAIYVSRREVAHRELAHAIKLHLRKGDPVIIHLLASASYDISEPVARKAGKQTTRVKFEEMVRPEYLDSWRELRKKLYNFLKHGGADPHEVSPPFNPKLNDMLLWEACADYQLAFNTLEFEMLVYLSWFIASYPELLLDEYREKHGPILHHFANLDEAGRLAFADEMLTGLSQHPEILEELSNIG